MCDVGVVIAYPPRKQVTTLHITSFTIGLQIWQVIKGGGEHVLLHLKGCLLCKLCNVCPAIVDIDSSLVVASIVCIGCSYRNVWKCRIVKSRRGGGEEGGGH